MNKKNFIKGSLLIIVVFFSYMMYFCTKVLPMMKENDYSIENGSNTSLPDILTRGLFLDLK
ncbi:hypothetical protein [Gynurincola endophyticus]|uniref:hypothetical protein n=1 Tax=Gynurincola endophyticus TaxID=2479004 RepID=UPI000F8F6DC8|nr:hypothetical protein [Gynurincola endophyticus]